MKNFILTFALLLITLTSSFANNNPVIESNTFTIEAISFEMDMELKKAYGITIDFVQDQNSLFVNTGKEVNFLQVLNAEGVLEYQLPIFSNDIVIDLNDFQEGDFQLNLLMSDEGLVTSKFTK